ncbi:MAG: Rieske (2Fe-2S) protein [Porticoccaceae bacterium]
MLRFSLGALNDIPENGCRSFDLTTELLVFVVRKDGVPYIYRNRCPHARLPLNWAPDRFLDRSGCYVQCSVHGALFDIPTGRCIAGPCTGESLTPIEYDLIDGSIHIDG